MITKNLTTGEIEQVLFDPGSRYLEVRFRNKRLLAFRPVPEEIARRLCNAPNPSTYLDDRIVEEYPKVEPKKSQATDNTKAKLDDLFGG